MLASRFKAGNRAFCRAHTSSHRFLRKASPRTRSEHFARNSVLNRECLICGLKTSALSCFLEESVVVVGNGLILDLSHSVPPSGVSEPASVLDLTSAVIF
jgi:hypothetical protein